MNGEVARACLVATEPCGVSQYVFLDLPSLASISGRMLFVDRNHSLFSRCNPDRFCERSNQQASLGSWPAPHTAKRSGVSSRLVTRSGVTPVATSRGHPCLHKRQRSRSDPAPKPRPPEIVPDDFPEASRAAKEGTATTCSRRQKESSCP